MLCLTRPTDPRWLPTALQDLDAVLLDHAHCELKAATNALSLTTRASAFPRVIRALLELAEEEIRHYRAVLEELERRGVPLAAPPVDAYAAEVRKLANSSASRRTPEDALCDRLLVGALIEARSCERFRLLADALGARGEQELASFYEELFAAEARHYRTFVDLAAEVSGDLLGTRERLRALAEAEGELCDRLGVEASVHG
jgi:tRNA-(ms[2]io[6]A)-hydroxylase